MRFAWIVLLAGCSFVFVSGPPASAPPNADCTESRVAPIADVVLTSALLAGGIAGVSAKNNCQPMSDIDCLGSGLGVAFANVAGVIALLGALGFGVSALDGFSDTGACRSLHASAPARAQPWNPDQR